MDLPAVICNLIISKSDNNESQRKIARDLKLPQSTVSTVILRYRRTGQAAQNRRGRCGKKKLLSARDCRRLHMASQENPRRTAREIQSVVGGHIATVSLSTVRRSLQSSGLVTYRPVTGPNLSAKQRNVRLTWARKFQNWTVDMWKKVRMKKVIADCLTIGS